jgi:hypothetical protein
MAQSNQTEEHFRPFLARFAVPRSIEPTRPGYYSAERSLWVIDTPEGVVPAAGRASDELTTLTRVGGEPTDDSGVFGQLAAATETAVGGEQSDIARDFSVLAMATITEVGGEQTDKAKDIGWIAMGAKSRPTMPRPSMLCNALVSLTNP